MPFFVYYDFGSCNNGDHCYGLKEFRTHREAAAGLAELKALAREYGEEGAGIVVVEGATLAEALEVGRPEE
jgi:hypothetical protein